ncbi:unnamed protein product [Durusdinium trenchii]|uniref:Uracil-DNA glycosylase-like domain-containing protein n=1 Tax=Durusdinium trenchii TaxID=1381693 RepID=A0ABP0N5H1_9DINO
MAERIPRGLVVGQAPPLPPESLSSDYKPLQGQPEKRLARLAGLSLDELWAFFDRVDLLGWCPGKKDRKSYHQWSAGYRKHRCDGHRFPLSVARLVAARLRRFGRLERYAVVVLCGRLVAAAFALSLDRCVPWTEEQDGVRFLVLPHPSGVSHFWNDEESWHRAAMVFRSALRAAGLRACQDNLHESTVQTQHHEAELDEENLESLETKTQVPKVSPPAEPVIRSKFFNGSRLSCAARGKELLQESAHNLCPSKPS